MKTPSQIVYVSLGSPAVDGVAEHDGTCWLCGGPMTSGVPREKWMGSNFVGQNRVRNPTESHVCVACVFVCSRTSPVLGRPPKEGKKFGGNYRNYSHLWERDICFANASKGDKSAIRMFLARRHTGDWFAAIADSGQKHVLPWAPINAPGRAGVLLFDEQPVRVPNDQRIISDMADTLTAGATKDEIATGEYRPQTWIRCRDAVATFEQEHGWQRGGAWFGLAIWLAQRDEEATAARQAAEKEAKNNAKTRGKRRGKAANADGGGDPSGTARVPGDVARQHNETLGSVAGANPQRRTNDGQPRGVAVESGARPGTPGAQQTLFDGID